ncbi:hypothetical protein AOG23_23435 [Rhizobium acidisoli]|nr:hypothetical protein AOG23_23435 [Rhizobium acidisoli]
MAAPRKASILLQVRAEGRRKVDAIRILELPRLELARRREAESKTVVRFQIVWSLWETVPL